MNAIVVLIPTVSMPAERRLWYSNSGKEGGRQDTRPSAPSCQLLHHLRKDPLIGLAVGHGASGVATTLHAAVQGHSGIVLPQVLLGGQDLESLALRLPHVVDVEDQSRFVIALFGLVWFEQKHGWRGIA